MPPIAVRQNTRSDITNNRLIFYKLLAEFLRKLFQLILLFSNESNECEMKCREDRELNNRTQITESFVTDNNDKIL